MNNPYLSALGRSTQKPKNPYLESLSRPAQTDTLDTYLSNTTAPEPQRAPFLSRLGSAAKALGKQAIDDPIGTVAGIGKGLAQNAMDLGSMATNPGSAAQRIVAQEGGDPLRAGARVSGAASLLLGPALRAAGAPLGAVLAGDYAMSAGLGAAQTPDDPAVGAVMGLGMNAVFDGGSRFMSRGAPTAAPAPTGPVRRAVRGTLDTSGDTWKVVPATSTGSMDKALTRLFPVRAVDEIAADKPDIGQVFDQPDPKPATTDVFPEGYTAEPRQRVTAPGALERVLPGMVDAASDPRRVADLAPTPRSNAPVADEVFPEGYSAGGYTGERGTRLDDAMARLFPERAASIVAQRPNIGQVFDEPNAPFPPSSDVFPEGYSSTPPRRNDLDRAIQMLVPREVTDNAPMGRLDVVRPRETPFPAADRQFPEGFTMPETFAVRSATPKRVMPADTPLPDTPTAPMSGAIPAAASPALPVRPDAPVAPSAAAMEPSMPLPTPRTSTVRAPESPATALDAPLTPPAAAAIPEVPPARVDAPMEPPAPVAAAMEPPPAQPPAQPAASAPMAGPAGAVTAPSKDGTINWKTWFDPASPGSKTAEARLQALIQNDPDIVKGARGYESMAVTNAKATAAMKELVAELTDDPLAADLPGIRKFVERHGAAGVPAMKKLIAQNEQALQDASRVVANSTDPQEIALAQRVIDGVEQQQTDLLRGTVKEQAGIARGLNALKLRAKMSTDPDVWLVQAQRSMGDVPMSDTVRNEVRRLARVAADACGGA